MTPTADEYARMTAEYVARFPSGRGKRHLYIMTRNARTQQLRDEVRLCHMTRMLAACVEESIAEFGDD